MKIIKYLKSVLVTGGIILIASLLITTLSYFNLFPIKSIKAFSLIIPTLAMLVGAFLLGRETKEKGWLEGLKLGGIYLIITILINLLFFRTGISSNLFLYDGILLLASMLGSMIGINFRKRI